MKHFGILRILALALMMLSTRGGDGSDSNTDTNTGDTPATDTPATGHTDTPATATHDTQTAEGTATQDTQSLDGTCCYQGPQVHAGFGDGPCCSDSCSVEYRFGPFVWTEPIFDPISFDLPTSSYGGRYVPPMPAMPSDRRRGAASHSLYMPSVSETPDWEEQEWICAAVKGGRICGHPNHPTWNETQCGLCDTPRPVAPTPVAACSLACSMPARSAPIDPLSIESPPASSSTADRSGTCCVCLARVNEVVLLGPKDAQGQYQCRHQCMCRNCAAHMRTLAPGNRRCPMCRKPTQFYVVADTVPGGFKTYQGQD